MLEERVPRLPKLASTNDDAEQSKTTSKRASPSDASATDDDDVEHSRAPASDGRAKNSACSEAQTSAKRARTADAPPPLTRAEYTAVSKLAARATEQAAARLGSTTSAAALMSQGAYAIQQRANYALLVEARSRDERTPRLVYEHPFNSAYFLRAFTVAIDAARPPRLTDEADRAMRRETFVSTREHEDSQLRTPDAPLLACTAGTECAGTRLQCGGAVLMAYHTELEWQRYTAERARRGNEARALRADELAFRGRCLACVRVDALDEVLKNRALGRAMPWQPTPRVVARLVNPVDVRGAYRSQDCIGPRESVFEGLAGPLVRFNVFAFARYQQGPTTYFRQTLAYPEAPSREALARAHAAGSVVSDVAAAEQATARARAQQPLF